MNLLADFHRDGFVVCRSVVARDAVEQLRAAIASALEADETIGAVSRYAASSFCPALRDAPRIVRAFDPVLPLAASLLGVEVRASRVQIALVFPSFGSSLPPTFHLDGFPAPDNGVPAASIHRHTLLCGLFLSPIRSPDAGALCVWPGSHRRLASQIAALDPTAFLARSSPAALLERISKMDVGEPMQLMVEPGDVVFAHHLVAHAAASNLSVRVRHALYVRFQHPEHDPSDIRSLVDPGRWFAH